MLRRTLELRDAYLAPLHALQVSLLARARDAARATSPTPTCSARCCSPSTASPPGCATPAEPARVRRRGSAGARPATRLSPHRRWSPTAVDGCSPSVAALACAVQVVPRRGARVPRPCEATRSARSDRRVARRRSAVVGVETAARLATEQAGVDHPREQRRGGVERLLELLVERLGDRLGGVEADQVGERERALRVGGAQDQAAVDVARRWRSRTRASGSRRG